MAGYDRPYRGWGSARAQTTPHSGQLPGWMVSRESGKPSTTGGKFIPPVKPSDATRRSPTNRPQTKTEVKATTRVMGDWIARQQALGREAAAARLGLKPGVMRDRSGLANRRVTAPGSTAPKGTRMKHTSAARERVTSIRQARMAAERNALPGSRTPVARQRTWMTQSANRNAPNYSGRKASAARPVDAVTGKPFTANPNLKGNAATRAAAKPGARSTVRAGARGAGNAIASTGRALAGNLAGAGLNIALMRGAFTAQDIYDRTIGKARAANERDAEAFRRKRGAMNAAVVARMKRERQSNRAGRKAGF